MTDGPLVPFDEAKPNQARHLNYAMGGKDHFALDRAQHAELMEIFPLAEVLVRENREFLVRAVSYVAAHGVTQFIDVGCGLPASPGIHEIADQACADARVAYVDNDPMVIAHTAAVLASPGRVAAVPGDVHGPEDILASTALTSVIDVSRPFCVILGVVLDFVDPAQAAQTVAAFSKAMPPGSFVILSIGMNNNTPDVAEGVIKVYRAGSVHLHSREQVAGYLAGLELAEPGLTEARRWRPAEAAASDGSDGSDGGSRAADILAGVARKADCG